MVLVVAVVLPVWFGVFGRRMAGGVGGIGDGGIFDGEIFVG